MKSASTLVMIFALAAPVTFAQDSGGNGLLAGNSYRFRYVAPLGNSATGAINQVIAANGVITFQSGGTYTIAAGSTYTINTQNGGKPQSFPASAATSAAGSYVINAAGLGYISSPIAVLSSSFQSYYEFGEYSDGVFTGSATDSGLADMFVVMLVGTPPSSFTSSYWLGFLDFSGGGDVLIKNGVTELVPSGSGLSPLSVTGYEANYQAGTLLTQTVNATSTFAADGGATLTLPVPSGLTTSNALFTGSRLVYTSSDGNFLLGWNPSGYDIIFGVKALTAPATNSLYTGLYYTAGLSDIPLVVKGSTIESGCGAQSYWGSTQSYGNGSEVDHERFFSPYCSFTGSATDYSTDNYVQLSSTGSAQDALGNYDAFGAAGKAFVGVSNAGGVYSLSIGIQAPASSTFCTGSSPCLYPTGVFNGASWDPVTAGIAPGELFTLFGTDLAPSTVVSQGNQPFPTLLGQTQVLVNGDPAPIYYVSPTQVSAIMPYETASSTSYTAEIQLYNGFAQSKQISVYLTDANSGAFAQSEQGIGDAVAVDLTKSMACSCTYYVNANHPALPGDVITLAFTGMGTVTPTIPDGAVGPSSPFSYANVYSNQTNCTTTTGPNCNLLVEFNDYINGSTFQQATVGFAGLFPGLAGLYQMNVTVPTNVGPGDVYVEVVTDAADVEQVTICVTGSCSPDAETAANTATNLTSARAIEGGPSPQLLQHRKAAHAKPIPAAVRMFKPQATAFPRVPAPQPAPASPQN